MNEAIKQYQLDLGHFDRVVLTPQHARNRRVLKVMANSDLSRVIAICNSYCARDCNSYWQYALVSHVNKKPLSQLTRQDLKIIAEVFAKQFVTCPVLKDNSSNLRLAENVRRLIQEGIINIKTGRGIGVNLMKLIRTLCAEGRLRNGINVR